MVKDLEMKGVVSVHIDGNTHSKEFWPFYEEVTDWSAHSLSTRWSLFILSRSRIRSSFTHPFL